MLCWFPNKCWGTGMANFWQSRRTFSKTNLCCVDQELCFIMTSCGANAADPAAATSGGANAADPAAATTLSMEMMLARALSADARLSQYVASVASFKF